MNTFYQQTLPKIIAFVIIASVFFIFLKKQKKDEAKRKANIKLLKEKYDAAIKIGDKQEALACGRKYYAALRDGKRLTIYDEQAISNDLAAMKNNI
jgi:hypothetical protein